MRSRKMRESTNGEPVGPATMAPRWVLAIFGSSLISVALAAGCAGGDGGGESATAQPAAVAPAAAPTSAPTASSASVTNRPVSDMPLQQQKAALVAIVNERLAGLNNKERPRLSLAPDARDHRQGGIWITIEFNGDEYDAITKRKTELDKLMRDTYEALFTAGFDLTWVDMTAIMIGTIRDTSGGTAKGPIQVYKTRMKRDMAKDIDWANKESLDFAEIWDTLTLNPIWRRALKAAEEGG